MMSFNEKTSVRSQTVLATLAAAFAVALACVLIAAPISSAYEGPFCYGTKLKARGGFCQSRKEPNTRRAIGRSEGGYTAITIDATNGESLRKECETVSCSVSTGYLKQKDEVVGVIENIGEHEHPYYGYLYP